MPLMGEVDPGRFTQPHEIDSAVLEEAAVFDGRDRFHHELGDVVVLHQLTLRALLGVKQRSQHLGLEFISLQLAGDAAVDGRNRAAGDGDGGCFGAVIRLGSGQNFNGAAMHMVAAQRIFSRLFGIAGMTQLRRNFREAQLRSELHHRWSSENLGRSGERRTAETLLDDAVVLDIPIGKKAEHHERCREKTEQGNAQHWIVGQQAAFPAAFSSLAAASKYRDFQLNGHEESWASTKSNSHSENWFLS